MISWQSEGIVLGHKSFGEEKLILSLFSKDYGRMAGLIRSTKKLQLQGAFQQGALVDFCWKARLESHLGTLSLEVKQGLLGHIFSHTGKLLALNAATLLLHELAPERHPYPVLYETLHRFLEALKGDLWIETYLHFEEKVLQEMGFGLKLKECCVTGVLDDLVYVSPKTGRSVSESAGRPYHDKLLRLPPFLKKAGTKAETDKDVLDGFSLLGYFLEKHVGWNAYTKISRVRTQLMHTFEKKLEKPL
jgi:DNA repair protein RecO (recombination protein O)